MFQDGIQKHFGVPKALDGAGLIAEVRRFHAALKLTDAQVGCSEFALQSPVIRRTSRKIAEILETGFGNKLAHR
jgi:hypothetical protein